MGLDDVKKVFLQQEAAGQANLLVIKINLLGRIFAAFVSRGLCAGGAHEVHKGGKSSLQVHRGCVDGATLLDLGSI